MADAKKANKQDSAKEAELKADEKARLAAAPDGAPAEGAETEEPAPKFSKKKIAIFAAVPLLIILIGGGVAWKMGYLDALVGHKKLDCSQVAENDKDYNACADELAKSKAEAPPGVFVDVPDMIVNLNSTTKQPRFLKISLKVELEDAAAQKNFEAIMPRIIDQFQTYLRELRLEDLRGSSGMYRMKIELLSRVRAAAPEMKVRDVLFQEILVQ